ncbi:MAG TPA: glycosyltransferase family 39 protein, partial [Xanthomonadaceae bacterium]|nr:glycosyltransferase family 39 protein [Xanthomonadaceae bacterium]
MGRSAHRDLLWLAALALVLLGAGLGLRDPWPPDEPRFALIARDMVETGRWFVPWRGPELYAEKPPLFLWVQAAFYALTGQMRLAFLLPSLLAALATLALTWDLTRRLWNPDAARWATFLLLFTVQFTLQGRSGQIDALLMLWTTLGLYGLLRHLLLGPAWGWYMLAGFATGLGVITKGTGFLPWLLLLPWAFARARGWPGLWREPGGWRWSLGPLAMLAAIALWLGPLLILAATSGDPALAAYRDELLFRQTLTRFADPWHHHQPWWYYFAQVVPLLWLPLSLLSLWALPAWRAALRAGDPRVLLPLAWVGLVLLFFTLSPGKREVYVLPALPALALALAPCLPALMAREAVQRTLWVLALGLSLALAVAAAWALLGRPGFAVRVETLHQVAPWRWLLPVCLAAATAVLLLGWRRGIHALTAVLAALWLGYGLIGYPSMTDGRSARGLMARVEAALPPGGELALLDVPEQVLLHAPHGAFSFGFRTAPDTQRARAHAWLQEGQERHLLMQRNALGDCIDEYATLDMGWSNRREWRLVPARSLDPACVARSGHGDT